MTQTHFSPQIVTILSRSLQSGIQATADSLAGAAARSPAVPEGGARGKDVRLRCSGEIRENGEDAGSVMQAQAVRFPLKRSPKVAGFSFGCVSVGCRCKPRHADICKRKTIRPSWDLAAG